MLAVCSFQGLVTVMPTVMVVIQTKAIRRLWIASKTVYMQSATCSQKPQQGMHKLLNVVQFLHVLLVLKVLKSACIGICFEVPFKNKSISRQGDYMHHLIFMTTLGLNRVNCYSRKLK